MVKGEGIGQQQTVSEIWAAYMKKPRDARDFFDLIKDPATRPEFWKKAIDSLLADGISSIPELKQYDGLNRSGDKKGISWAQELTGDQVLYVTGELPHYIERRKQREEENHFFDRRYGDAPYNSIILDLLPELYEGEAEKLFGHFDPLVGFDVLFQRRSSYDKWKRKAVEFIHGKIEKEKSEDPSKKDTLIFYEGILRDSTRGFDKKWNVPEDQAERDHYDDREKFLAREIAYLISIDPLADRKLLSNYSYDLDKVFSFLEGDAKRIFAERQVLSKDLYGGFGINHTSERFALKVIEEFPDHEMAKRLKQQLAAHKGLQTRNQRASIARNHSIEEKAAKERKIRDSMKRS